MNVTLHNIDEEFYNFIGEILNTLTIDNYNYYLFEYKGFGFRFTRKNNKIDIYCIT